MGKYTDEVKKQCVDAVRSGAAVKDISEQYGPNAKAIARYCKAEGVEVPKQPRKARVDKKKEDTDIEVDEDVPED